MYKLRSDDAAVAVWSSDLSPDDPNLRALSLSRGSVDECYSLSKVESVRTTVSQPFHVSDL